MLDMYMIIIDLFFVSFLIGAILCFSSFLAYDDSEFIQVFLRFFVSQKIIFRIIQITIPLIDHKQWNRAIVESFEFFDVTGSKYLCIEFSCTHFNYQILSFIFDHGIEIWSIRTLFTFIGVTRIISQNIRTKKPSRL